MIASMTGFGRGTAEAPGISATVEIRTVNNRFCEVSIRGPREMNAHEHEVQRRVKDRISRGRVSVQIQVDVTTTQAEGQRVDQDAARTYRALLEDLRKAAGIEDPVRLDHLLRFSDVFVQKKDDADLEERIAAAVFEALEASLEHLVTMRRKEGDALRDELLLRAANIEAELVRVEARAPERLPEARDRLRERVAEIAGDVRIDPERLEQELIVLADKLDITEECVRLRSHLEQFRETLDTPEPVGRRLNFLSQEINREVNTIGSKANDPEIAHYAVTMKEELEKIREQVENVE